MDKQEPQGSPQKTFLMLQSGRLNINLKKNKAIFIMGNSKSGKTTLSHHLMNHILTGKQGTNRIYFQVTNVPDKYKDARIGQKKSISETQIPNVFEKKLNNQEIILVDCPGFLDSYGCYRSLSNFYFIDLLFNKVNKVNFILVVKHSELAGQALTFKNSLTSFFKIFKNDKLNEIRQKLISSICLVITQVKQLPNKNTTQQLLNQIEQIKTDFGSQTYNQMYKKLKQHLVKTKSLFFIPAAVQNMQNNSQNTLLGDIISTYKNNCFEIDPTKSPINISINDYIQQSKQKFNKQLEEIGKFYQQEILTGIKMTAQIMDAFLTQCKNINQQEPIFRNTVNKHLKKKNQRVDQFSKDQQYREVYAKFKSKRQAARKQLFLPNPYPTIFSDYPPLKQHDVQPLIYKVKFLKTVCQSLQQINKFSQKQREIQYMVNQIAKIKQNFDLIINFTKKMYPKNENQVVQLVHILYEQVFFMKQIYKIFDNTAKQGHISNQNPPQYMRFIYLQFPTDLKKAFILKYDYNDITQLSVNIIKQKKQLSSTHLQYYYRVLQEVNQFFLNKKDNAYQDFLKQSSKKQLDIKIQIQSNRICQKSCANVNQIQILEGLRSSNLKNYGKDPNLNQHIASSNNKILQLQALYFKNQQKFYIAQQIYEQLNDAYQVLNILAKRQKQLDVKYAESYGKSQQDKQKILEFQIQYMHKAYKYGRMQLATEKAHKAYSFAQKLGEINKMKDIGQFLQCIIYKVRSFRNDDNEIALQSYIKNTKAQINKIQLSDRLVKYIQNQQKKLKKQSPNKQM